MTETVIGTLKCDMLIIICWFSKYGIIHYHPIGRFYSNAFWICAYGIYFAGTKNSNAATLENLADKANLVEEYDKELLVS